MKLVHKFETFGMFLWNFWKKWIEKSPIDKQNFNYFTKKIYEFYIKYFTYIIEMDFFLEKWYRWNFYAYFFFSVSGTTVFSVTMNTVCFSFISPRVNLVFDYSSIFVIKNVCWKFTEILSRILCHWKCHVFVDPYKNGMKQ